MTATTVLSSQNKTVLTRKRGSHGDPSARHPGLRCRQPPLRDPRLVDQVPARSLPGRDRLRRRPGPHQDRRARPDQRVHPEPHLRRGRPTGRPGGLLPQGQPRRQEPPRALRRADEGDPGVPRAHGPGRADGRAGHRSRAHVPDAGQPGRGAAARRPRGHPRGGPLAQPVDRRDLVVQLREPHLHHAGDHPAHRRPRHRRARVGGRAGREGGADPPRPGAGLPWLALVRPARVRSLLAAGGRARRARRHARVRQRLRALRQRLDGQQQRDAAVPARGVPHALGLAAGRGRRLGARVPRRPVAVPRPSRWR